MEGEQRSSEKDGDEQEIVYKTKVVQFLGRSTPIILQNDNGPCPLLAICNVLLLRNSLNLGVDAPEVSLQKLLSLVAEKLIDSNNNIEGKDEGYAINQQQNIADAIDLLPRLATGIDVNVQFRKINDFEFTRECAIFDLLDIGLYHGWLVDPQDTETASAIGSKSYNTLVGELVAFETSNSGVEDKNLLEEDSVDFAAATTAALGVPSPCLSRGMSFDECPESVPLEQRSGEGDIEEIEQLLRAVNMSKTEMSNPVTSLTPEANSSNTADGSSGDRTDRDSVATQMEAEPEHSHQPDLFTPSKCDATVNSKDGAIDPDITLTDNNISLSDTNILSKMDQSVPEGSNSNIMISSDLVESVGNDMSMSNINPFVQPSDSLAIASTEDQSVSEPEGLFTPQPLVSPADNPVNRDAAVFPSPSAPCADAHLANGTKELSGASEVGSSSFDDSEPLYEGEECILDPEPVYEGEALLARQCDRVDACTHSEEKAARQQCYVVKNFLESSASQLTFYGLFCLQEGLKERELCVFFRNNHFNTMFKFKGQLYLLATDQGYINQPDLVWEKLNEVNGDTIFMTGNFTEFKIENETNKSWSEQNAMTSTADYLATLEASNPASSFNSDLQLAIALQQQEFGQQSQQQQHQHEHQPSSQQPAASGRSRLVTGPQVARSSYTSPKSESKKEKCTIM